MRHPTRIRQLHGFFDAEQLDNAQNLLKLAIKGPPGAPGVPGAKPGQPQP
jgi:RNA polymerase primary sigma factor